MMTIREHEKREFIDTTGDEIISAAGEIIKHRINLYHKRFGTLDQIDAQLWETGFGYIIAYYIGMERKSKC